jgi:flagellar biosynthesis protein FlhA
MLRRFIKSNSDLFLVGGVIGILLVLFVPIPTSLLDFLIILNFSFGMTILMLTFYVVRPVEFSTFPSLLLVATLFRLSLNIAATRLILTAGNAGDVINSVGSFAIQGNFVVGLVVFFILIVVQYVVITAGAQRVSEVAARFTLDSLPGQQMSIDADLNMGLIDQEEAKTRRKLLEKEASFYGAMDGASKFVKGDAVAGIIIVLINIIAGWIIGMAQLGLDWSEALQRYTLLTIGDGIVTQVPALVISVATGIIVTRSSADRQLSAEVASQLSSVPKIPLIVMTGLLLLLLLPGMPKWPIMIILSVLAALWFGARGVPDLADVDGASLDGADNKGAALTPSIAISLGLNLSQAWEGLKPVIGERIAALRAQQETVSGFAFPSVVVRDGGSLGASDYEIALHGAPHASASVYPHKTLAIRSASASAALTGLEARDPAFGLPAVWIDDDQKELARTSGYTLVDPMTALITHLSEVVRAEAPMLLTRANVVALLEGVRERQSGLIEELVPQIMSVSDVQRIFQNLLSEQVSIRNPDLLCEALVDVGRFTKDSSDLTELVRQRFSHMICNDLRNGKNELSVLSLDPKVEARITETIGQADSQSAYVIDPKLAENMIRVAAPLVDSMIQSGLSPVLLCGPSIRRQLRAFMRRAIPRLAIISVNEVPQSIDLRSFGIVKVD